MNRILSQYLFELRRGFNLNFQEASKLIGISQSTISALEDPLYRGIPMPRTLKKIADAYKVSYIEILEKAGYITNSDEVSRAKSKILFEEFLIKDIGEQETKICLNLLHQLHVKGLNGKNINILLSEILNFISNKINVDDVLILFNHIKSILDLAKKR